MPCNWIVVVMALCSSSTYFCSHQQRRPQVNSASESARKIHRILKLGGPLCLRLVVKTANLAVPDNGELVHYASSRDQW